MTDYYSVSFITGAHIQQCYVFKNGKVIVEHMFCFGLGEILFYSARDETQRPR